MIARDGHLTSLWQGTTEPYTVKNRIKNDGRYDVIIAGGGITGITTGLLLQHAGVNCLICEANTLCFRTTGGTTAHLNTLLDTPYPAIIKNFDKKKAKLVAKASAHAIELVKNNMEAYGIDCGFKEVSAYLFAQTKEQREELEEIGQAAQEVGLDTSYVKSMPLQTGFEKILNIKGQAKFHPVKYVHALAAGFEDAGGCIAEHCRVISADNEENVVRVETALGKFEAPCLIYSTHIPPGISLPGLRCAPYRTYAMAGRVSGDKYPEGLFYDMYDPYHYYRTQEIDGQKYLIVGGEDHKTAHAENTETCFLHLEAHIRAIFDVSSVDYHWSSQYFDPVDGLPYIGHMPGEPGRILVATGFCGNGMTYSAVAASVLKSIVLQEDNELIDLFNPNRMKPVAGFSNFIKENADVVEQLVGRWFGHKEKLEELAGLAPGEGRVVTFEGEQVGMCKDDGGGLHAVDEKDHPLAIKRPINLAEALVFYLRGAIHSKNK